jgi:NAD(P)-dependent dehydrogenase (short-subunit alcohol dehydrogenase family)
MDRFESKRVVITGGTTGIGMATAKRFMREGARVLVTGWNEERLAHARAELGLAAQVVRSDAGDAAAQREVAASAAEAFGEIDVVVVNAGIGVFKPLDAWDEAAFDRSMAVNLKGPFFLLQALAPHLADPASVILVGSINAHVGSPTSSVYSATKAALGSLARTLSGELVGRGVRVNTLSPGTVTTPIYGKLGLPDDALRQMTDALVGRTPAGRFGTPEEIAAAIAFLAADESAYVIGSELIVDGGFIMA